MKRTIICIRHADAGFDSADGSDLLRELSRRGKQELPIMASYLIQHYPPVEIALSSTALRTKTTIESLKNFGVKIAAIDYKEELYNAPEERLRSAIASLPEETTVAALCCHNPGINDFIAKIAGDFSFDMPTLGIVQLDFNAMAWVDIYSAKAKISRFDFPKKK